jgi:hypothetical protein
MRALRDYLGSLTSDGLDGAGGRIVTLLNLENDLCPHPERWLNTGGWNVFPPIYGTLQYGSLVSSNAGVRFVQNLRDELKSPYTGRYVRGFVADKGWAITPYQEHGIALRINFEFDAAALYAETPTAPSWMRGQFAEPVRLPGAAGISDFYAHGYIDHIGQETAPDGDPAYVFKQFGRDIADAVREEVLSFSP